MLPVLISLGIWQLSRYEQKLVLKNTYESRKTLKPHTISEVLSYEDPLYLPVTVSGHFDVTHYFLLDNQIYQGEPGYELLMPFLTDGGNWLLINRGWLAGGSREQLPVVTKDKKHQTLIGVVYKPLGKPFMLAEDIWSKSWPKRIQAFDHLKMSEAIGHTIPDFFIMLRSGEPGAERIRPTITNLKSEKHRGYAFQWFAMAFILCALYGFQMRQKR